MKRRLERERALIAGAIGLSACVKGSELVSFQGAVHQAVFNSTGKIPETATYYWFKQDVCP